MTKTTKCSSWVVQNRIKQIQEWNVAIPISTDRCYYLATSCKNLVNFSSVTPEFKKGKDVHFFVDQQFGHAAPLQC